MADIPAQLPDGGKSIRGNKKKDKGGIKLDLSGVKVKAEASAAVAQEKKTGKSQKEHDGLVTKYLAVVKTRHPSLPANVVEEIGKATTKGQAKRVLQVYLSGVKA